MDEEKEKSRKELEIANQVNQISREALQKAEAIAINLALEVVNANKKANQTNQWC